VFLIGRSKETLQKVVDDIKAKGGNAWAFVADLGDPEQVKAAFEAADKLGSLQTLVTAAGLGVKTVSDTDRAFWNTVVGVNLMATMDCCNQAALRMGKSKGGTGGKIVTIGSLCVRAHDKGDALYVATKTGVVGFVDTWRREVADDGIEVSIVHPGAIASPMDPHSEAEKEVLVTQHELLTPDSVAAAIEFCLTRPSGVIVPDMFIVPSQQQGLL
jgi:NADP-dependent 3-hydroxy acid dehydrogenase YdfG